MKRIFVFLLALMMAFVTFTGCNKNKGNNTSGGENNRPIDYGKTQLSVSNFNGAFGMDWIYEAIKRFETKYQDTEFEEGKKGVQVTATPVKTVATGIITTMQDSATEIYFNEQVYYYDAVSSGLFLDISDVVTEVLSEFGESGTIEEKLTKEQQEYYKTADGKYYALPHYMGFFGITYDVDLFEEQGFYLAYNRQNKNGGFVAPNSNEEKAYGPDGIKGTYDDGLPATYDDFFMLCERIAAKGLTPITWAGSQNDGYWREFLTALYGDYEGLEQMMLNYKFNGTAKNIVTDYDITEDGVISNMQTHSVDITENNGYELYGQAGRAYALSFFERILDGSYFHSDGTDGSISNLEAQYTYIESKAIASPIAMYLDGSFWANEARENGTFDMVAEFGEEYEFENRRFGFMPMPKADSNKIGKQTLTDYLYSCAFINANIAEEKKEVAKLFLKFLYTDESLREFTVITNSPKSINYDMGDSYDDLTYFGQTVWQNKQNSDILYPYANNNLYLSNQQDFNLYYNWESKIGTSTKNVVIDALYQDKISSKDYFGGIITRYDQTYWKNNFSSYFN